jgi:hypothetical protein
MVAALLKHAARATSNDYPGVLIRRRLLIAILVPA